MILKAYGAKKHLSVQFFQERETGPLFQIVANKGAFLYNQILKMLT